MKILLLTTAIAFLLVGCNQIASENVSNNEDKIKEASIKEILEEPEKYKNEKVRVSGTIKRVCVSRGDKRRVKDDSGLMVQVMLNEFKNEFNPNSHGKNITVEGKLTTELLKAAELPENCRELELLENMREMGIETDINAIIKLESYEL